MRPARFCIAAFCVANLFLSSRAWSQDIKSPAATASGGAVSEDIIGGTIYSPDGVTHIIGDGLGGGFIFGSSGLSTFISNGVGGGTLYAPNSTGAIIGDGMGGGLLYSATPRVTTPADPASGLKNPILSKQ
jgi:hypothetical protein